MADRDPALKLGWKRRVRQVLSRRLRPVEAWGRTTALLTVDRLVLLTRPSPDAARVLLVRLDNIGDFVVWLDAAQAIVAYYRGLGKHVTLLANGVWSDWARELGVFDEVIPLEEKRYRRDLRYRWRMGRQLRSGMFGTAVQPAYTRILAGGDALVRVSGAIHRIGPVGVFDRGAERHRRRGDRGYTRLLATDDGPPGEMRRNASFVRALTLTSYKAKVARLSELTGLLLPRDLREELQASRYFVLFPGATFAGRLWPASRYVEVAERLHAETGFTGVICGGPGEAAQAKWMCEASAMPLLNWTGRTSLAGLAAVLAGAELLVGNETSAVHIAAAVGTSSVCIVGGGHYGRFMPYSVEKGDERPLPVPALHAKPCFHCDWRCVYHPPKGTPVPCIDEVTVQDAWNAVQDALAGRVTRPSTESGVQGLTVLQCR